jgi:serine/threonine-protein kinase
VHLESCPACQEALERLTAGEAEWQALGQPPSQPAPALRRAMDNLLSDGNTTCSTVGQHTLGPPDLSFLKPSPDPANLGRLGDYEILGVVGRGGMGVVLKAFDPALRRIVAIKVLAPQWATSEAARQRFEREARATAAVHHDNVVQIHAVEELDGLPYLVMEYVAGVSLQQLLDRTGPLDLELILRIGSETAAALAAAHAQGLIHRDVKPANILLAADEGDRVKLSDFGLARAVDDASLTQSGVIAGTPQYMAPEQARGEPLDHRADLFSLGSVLYALCTGRPPFSAETTLAVLRRVCDDTPEPIRQVNAAMPEWLVEIVEALHAKDPVDRLQSAEQVAGLLNQHLRHLQTPELVAEPPRLPRRAPPRRRRWPLVLAAAVLLFLCAGITGFATWLVFLFAAQPGGSPGPDELKSAQPKAEPVIVLTKASYWRLGMEYQFQVDYRVSDGLPPALRYLCIVRPLGGGTPIAQQQVALVKSGSGTLNVRGKKTVLGAIGGELFEVYLVAEIAGQPLQHQQISNTMVALQQQPLGMPK